MVRATHTVISCDYTTVDEVWWPDWRQSNINNINGLRFYH